jgi:HAD superfamily hydrolase (TIGR01509 family)
VLTLDSFDAVLFDMDGTLTKNAHLHDLAWEKVMLERYNYQIIQGDHRLHGGKTKFITESLLERPMSIEEASEFHEYKEATYREFAQGQIKALPGLLEYMDYLEQNKKKIALVTSADRTNTIFVLEALGLLERFDNWVIAEDVKNGKPHPEPFLLGASKLGLEPNRCIAHEDSLAGVTSAAQAGCYVIGLTTSQTDEALLEHGAKMAVPDYELLLELEAFNDEAYRNQIAAIGDEGSEDLQPFLGEPQ